MITPDDVSRYLLDKIVQALKEMPPQNRHTPIAHDTVLLGVADMLSELLSTLPDDLQKELLPHLLGTITSRVKGKFALLLRPEGYPEPPTGRA